MLRLGQVLDLRQPSDETMRHIPVLILDLAERQVALVVDQIIGGREIVVKSLGSHARRIHGVSGATLTGDGQVVLILNPADLVIESSTPDASFGSRDQSAPTDERDRFSVMIVDDSLSVRRVVSNLIRSAGWLPLAARDGLDALEIIQQSTKLPDLILVDIEMPRMDGYELMSTLRGNEIYQNIPLVVLTSRAGDKHRTKALGVGASEYIVKPYQDEMLIDTVRELVEEARKEVAR
jgi:chemosensory pili system protein ChpA (sensor histidine kinase/response regulator)